MKRVKWIIVFVLSVIMLIGAAAGGVFAAEEEPGQTYMTVKPTVTGSSAQDKMVYVNTPLNMQNGLNVYLEVEFEHWTNDGVIFFGLFSGNTDSAPYSHSSFLIGSQELRSFVNGAVKVVDNGQYNENQSGVLYYNQVMFHFEIKSNGDVKVYVKSTEDPATYEGANAQITEETLITEQTEFYSALSAQETYIGFALRGSMQSIEYKMCSIEVRDGSGAKIFKDNFSKFSTDAYKRSEGVDEAVEQGHLIIPEAIEEVPDPAFNYGQVKRSGYLDETFNLVPVVDDMPENGVLKTVVKDQQGNKIEAQEDGFYKFTAQGVYTADYTVTLNDEVVLQDSLKIYVKNHSTQPNAEENFNNGYFNGDMWTITQTGVAVKDKELIISDGTFKTKGFSEICYFTFDITRMQEGSASFDVIFGQDGTGYAIRFTNATTIEFITPEGSETVEIGKNFVEAALAGKSVTLRLELASDKAILYGRISDESVEVLETALCKLENIRLVGSVGITVPQGSTLMIDDVQFINMSGVDNPNTDTEGPSDPVTPDPDPDPGEDGNDGAAGGCSSSFTGYGVAGAVFALAAAVVITKKKKA